MQELGQKSTRVLHYLTAVCKDRESSTNCQVNGTATWLLGLREGKTQVWELDGKTRVTGMSSTLLPAPPPPILPPTAV